FVFVVGENQAEFTVHAGIIAEQSGALKALISGYMKEASDGKAIFEDMQEDTFIRFCQFAYTGDYATPDFTHIPSIDLPNITDLDEPVVKPELVMEEEEQVMVEEEEPVEEEPVEEEPPPEPNSNPAEDYTTVFLGHAQLYVFAEKWGIDVLKTLALSKLHKTLTSFTLYAVRRPDIVKLLRYTFSNDNTPDRVGVVDDLRSLVMLYTACEVESLVHCPEFLSLVGEGGQLAQNLVQMLMKRIN
ncbi:hypothetical protein B0O99DRAFT_458079, partial [Bisporella sp. PMI_857]